MRWPILLVTLLSLALLGATAPAPTVELEAAQRLLPSRGLCLLDSIVI